ncbi:hypothetical protein [Exiguobacterium sp. s192]|uniref:hypothetical protein n=1 Tax=Exiguobacterium sp. s192 TaxID=2751206 RepID=UPI001BE720AF|nr:hypothetical protein [Exiguobacterium sp. s192]
MEERKIVIIILEGDQDSTVFASSLITLFARYNLQVKVTNGDIFTKDENRERTGVDLINEIVSSVINPSYIQREDIAEIIQFVDIDGSYVNRENYEVDRNANYYNGKTYEYHERRGKIKVKNHNMLNRLYNTWQIKRKFQDELWNIKTVDEIPFSMYYYSINLEHFLSDNLFLDEGDKWDAVDLFVSRYSDVEEVYSFLNSNEKKISDEYETSWNYLTQTPNLFERAVSNINILFDKHMIR